MALLEVTDIHTYYGAIHALKGLTITVNQGEIVTLIGANRAEVEPEPATHRVERITRRVAGPALHLRVLVRDQVTALQLTGAQAVVQGEQIERGKADHEHDPGQGRGSGPAGTASGGRNG